MIYRGGGSIPGQNSRESQVMRRMGPGEGREYIVLNRRLSSQHLTEPLFTTCENHTTSIQCLRRIQRPLARRAFIFQVCIVQYQPTYALSNLFGKANSQTPSAKKITNQLSLPTTSKHPSNAPSNSPTRCFRPSFSSFKMPTTLQASDALTPSQLMQE